MKRQTLALAWLFAAAFACNLGADGLAPDVSSSGSPGSGSTGGGGTGTGGTTDGGSTGGGGSGGGGGGTGSGGEPDAGPPKPTLDCDGNVTEGPILRIGGCVRESDGLDCVGGIDEVMQYVALNDNDPMRTVVGPQAARMLVFLGRTAEISPGDPQMPASTDNPLVEIVITEPETEELISYYRGHIAFADNPGEGDLISTSGLFAIVEQDIAGLTLRVQGQVQDKDGVTRCSEVMIFVES